MSEAQNRLYKGMEKMKGLRIVAVFLAVLMLVAGISGCSRNSNNNGEETAEKITIILDWTPNTNHTGLYVAQAKGYYAEAGLEVAIEQPPEGDALVLAATGKAPFCITTQEAVGAGLALEEPMPVTAVAAILNHNTSGILSLKEKKIERFKDLEGKNYGTWDVPIYDEILKDAVTSDGGDFSKINMVTNNATDTITALQTDFDAVWVYYGWDGIIAQVKGLETNYLPFNEINPVFDYYTPVIAANNEFLTQNPDTVRRFMVATSKGYEYAAEHPEEAAEILLSFAPEIGEDVAFASQAYLSGEYMRDQESWGKIDQNRWDQFFAWMYEKGMIAKRIEPGVGMDNQYLPAAN